MTIWVLIVSAWLGLFLVLGGLLALVIELRHRRRWERRRDRRPGYVVITEASHFGNVVAGKLGPTVPCALCKTPIPLWVDEDWSLRRIAGVFQTVCSPCSAAIDANRAIEHDLSGAA